ncbi:MAG: hypothetical protein SVU32_00735 [Candidatus Nanohaloarchaea archaeon]|nr:hypothetical protein [Candidatus Nanohaloarchaea archaeon]
MAVEREELVTWQRPPMVLNNDRVYVPAVTLHQRVTHPDGEVEVLHQGSSTKDGGWGYRPLGDYCDEDGEVPYSHRSINEHYRFCRVEVAGACPERHDDVEWWEVQELRDPDNYVDEQGKQPKLTEVMG